MKKINSTLKLLCWFIGVGLLSTSCEYKEFADADYPEQMVYMPAANFGVYDVSIETADTISPTPGHAYRSIIDSSDMGNIKVIVPLGVYRSGITNDGNVLVNIVQNTDTISKLITAETLDAATLLLPTTNFTIPATVQIADGSDITSFNMVIDGNFLKSNPTAIYAIGVAIDSDDREVNSLLNTTVVLIDVGKLKL